MNTSPYKRLAVIGDPISHSLSPLIQNAALQKLGLNLTYEAIRVESAQLEDFVRHQSQDLLGFNVTIPHKTAIIPFLSALSPSAQKIAAVNTVLRKNNQWVGHNTDGTGYLASLEEQGFSPKFQHITLLGAGGAARAIAVALAECEVASIHIANRTLGHAQKLSSLITEIFPSQSCSNSTLEGKAFEAKLQETDLLINTTSIGLSGQSKFIDFPWKKLKPQAWVSDIVYRPRFTQFLKEAEQSDHNIHSGEGMLLHQGALALELWTGKKPDIKLMRKVLLDKLKEEELKSLT